MKRFIKRKVGDLFGFSKQISLLEERQRDSRALIDTAGVELADMTQRVASLQERLGYQISRNDGLRDALTRKTEEFDILAGTLEEHVNARVNASECHAMVRMDLEKALDHIRDILSDQTPGQVLKDAESFYNRFRSTKNCIKCGSEMIPLRSEDKKLCSNGACGHEVEWPLEEGQQYMHKRDVEPFVEDRSNVQESLDA